MKYFTITEIGFSYNDEIYSSNDEDGGRPMRLFKSQEAAELARLVLSRKKFTDAEELRNFYYSPTDIIKGTKALDSLAEKYGYDLDDADEDYETSGEKLVTFVAKLSDDEFKVFLDSIYLKFYTVDEVELVSTRNELLTSPEEWEREVGRKMKGEE